MDNNITYEVPLNEKSRTYLRLEYLFKQIRSSRPLREPFLYISLFKGILDLQELLERSDLKPDVLRDIEKLRERLLQWSQLPDVDQSALTELKQSMNALSNNFPSTPRLSATLKDDRLLTTIRQRFTIPSGLCDFDVPILHHWLNQPAEPLQKQIDNWLDSFSQLEQANNLILRLWRESSQFIKRNADNGFYQDTTECSELLRLQIPAQFPYYPTVSGYKHRFAIRFMPATPSDENEPEQLPFLLALV